MKHLPGHLLHAIEEAVGAPLDGLNDYRPRVCDSLLPASSVANPLACCRYAGLTSLSLCRLQAVARPARVASSSLRVVSPHDPMVSV